MAGFHNAVAKYPRSEGTVTQLMFDDAKMCIEAFGTVVPSDATAGYATGCRFVHTDGSGGTSVYVNEGTSSSCDFNAVITTANAAIGAADGLTVGGLIVPQHLEFGFVIPVLAGVTVYDVFLAKRSYTVTSVDYFPTTLQGGAMTITPVKATGTNVAASGTTPLLTAGFNGNTGLRTLQSGTLTATTADLSIVAGERLSIVLSTASTVHQGVVQFSLKRV